MEHAIAEGRHNPDEEPLYTELQRKEGEKIGFSLAKASLSKVKTEDDEEDNKDLAKEYNINLNRFPHLADAFKKPKVL